MVLSSTSSRLCDNERYLPNFKSSSITIDDPLAILHDQKQQLRFFHRRLFQKNPSSYAISRINPLFDDNDNSRTNRVSQSTFSSLSFILDEMEPKPSHQLSSGYNSSTTDSSKVSHNGNLTSDVLFSDLSRVLKTAIDGKCAKSEEQVLNEIRDIILVEINKRTASSSRVVSNSNSCDHRVYQNVPSSRTPPPIKSNSIFPQSEKPSYWQIYYDINHGSKMGTDYSMYDNFWLQKPLDQSQMCRGRPETDFTLDVFETEVLKEKLKSDKKWRCRCRIFISLLGFVFFILSVMAVSMMLTRGRRMFGSMV